MNRLILSKLFFTLCLSCITTIVLFPPGCGSNPLDDGGQENGETGNGEDQSDPDQNNDDSSDDQTNTDDTDGDSDTDISDQVRVLEDNISYELTAENEVELAGSEIPDLHPGNVIVSEANGGLLTRVLAIEQQGEKKKRQPRIGETDPRHSHRCNKKRSITNSGHP